MGGIRRVGLRIALVVVTGAVVWQASTPQRDLSAAARTAFIAPVLPQHWAYYTSDSTVDLYLPIVGSGTEIRVIVPGRRHWWTFNISQRGVAQLNAWQYIASQIPSADWVACNSVACPPTSRIYKPTVAPSSLACGSYQLAHLSDVDGVPVHDDPALRVSAVALVQLACR